MRLTRLASALTLASLLATPAIAGNTPHTLKISPLGTYQSGLFEQGAAEIVAHDARSQRLFVVNAASGKLDVLDIRDPAQPKLLFNIDLSAYGSSINSVAVHKGLVAAAVENSVKTEPGQVVFLDADGQIRGRVQVGALPDMLTFSHDGQRVLVANEGEPSDDYLVDPEGSVSIIDLPKRLSRLSQANVRTADFRAFSREQLDPSIRVFGPNASVAQDFEPEYITISKDGKRAWVTLQENNAIAEIDVRRAQVKAVHGLGYKDHQLAGNELDASDKDSAVNIRNWPIRGLYQPDAISSFSQRGQTYLVTANEGDARAYGGYSEEVRVGSTAYLLDPAVFPDAGTLKQNANLGRLTVSKASGLDPQTGTYNAIYAFGARSFSIWSSEGTRVYDSGADFERISAERLPALFNSNHKENTPDGRSDDKGPEPEGVTVSTLWGKPYAFIGLERISAVMVYDLSNPKAPRFVELVSNRDATAKPPAAEAGDLGPEGVMVIPAERSPLAGVPLLVVGNEVSGSTTLYRIDRQ
ncbi:choice-of-anchor I family protein [Pseudomonas sp. J452]|uniref:choice-of-anchor I family protein n=1 Tax=Pseudomonas sp. J452 TaxID=2898441 RepID=UPI0021AE2BAA|nr:choice-of-anchor I family protein [Pseudomonas sp. J452]UUY06976.1 choice-of-anchor I family protein [Pseudomonas sp. J452]